MSAGLPVARDLSCKSNFGEAMDLRCSSVGFRDGLDLSLLEVKNYNIDTIKTFLHIK